MGWPWDPVEYCWGVSRSLVWLLGWGVGLLAEGELLVHHTSDGSAWIQQEGKGLVGTLGCRRTLQSCDARSLSKELLGSLVLLRLSVKQKAFSGCPLMLSHVDASAHCFSLLTVPLTAMGEASMDPTISADSTAQQDSLFSMTDVFLISLITGLFTYWFFFRKKKEEVPDLPKMQTV